MSDTKEHVLQDVRCDQLLGEVPRRIYKTACSHCPSAHYPPDPESQDIAALPKEERIRYVFRCAWRQGALCKGVCDELGVTEADMDHPDLGMAR